MIPVYRREELMMQLFYLCGETTERINRSETVALGVLESR